MPWGRTLTFTDPFSYQSVMLGIDAKIYPTGRGEFHSELTQVGLNQRVDATLSRETAQDIREYDETRSQGHRFSHR